MGGRLPSPGRIPGDTSFGLASKVGHVNRKWWPGIEDTEDQQT
jgi:hypothetical protein